MRLFLTTLLALAISMTALAQSPLFNASKTAPRPATVDAKDTQGLRLNEAAFRRIRAERPQSIRLELAMPDGETVTTEWVAFSNLSADFSIGRQTADGSVQEDYCPGVYTYELQHAVTSTGNTVSGDGFSGVLLVHRNRVLATMILDGHQWELAPEVLDLKSQTFVGDYVLFDVAQSAGTNSFTCAVQDQHSRVYRMERMQRSLARENANPDCVEIALDVDNYTFGTFGNNCNAAVDWAVGVLAGVDLIYRNELNDLITLQATYVNVWETPEPWANIVDNAGSMLESFRTTWLTDSDLSTQQRDFVHLMTRRGDSGTGGIAYLDGVCNTYGYGFSAGMSAASDFIPLPSYSWNLDVVAHELGHNFGANHTHWCGWSGSADHPSGTAGGAIDGCYGAEGSCSDGPSVSSGTIMSYCHLNVGKTLEFHPVVEQQAFFPSLTNAPCFGGCVPTVTSCDIGCTDPTACNYSENAIEDDGSCSYDVDECGVCGGNNESCGGCTDPSACNYDPSAPVDDESCTYAPPGYSCDCTSNIGLVADLGASQSSSSTLEATGNLAAIEVTLVWVNTNNDGSWAGDALIEISAPDGSCFSVGGYNVSSSCALGTFAWPSGWNVSGSGTYTHSIDVSDLGMGGDGPWQLNVINGWTNSGGVNYDFNVTLSGVCTGPPTFGGCTDPEACNYDASATLDDGSCDFGTPAYFDSDGDGYGQFFAQYFCGSVTPAGTVLLDGDCNDANSTVYPGAPGTAIGIDNNCNGVIDVDEEEVVCPEDVNNDGAISVADVLALLSGFGCLEACEYDVDGDEAISVADVLLVLSAFGQTCE